MKAKRIFALITVILVVIAIVLLNRKTKRPAYQERLEQFKKKSK